MNGAVISGKVKSTCRYNIKAINTHFVSVCDWFFQSTLLLTIQWIMVEWSKARIHEYNTCNVFSQICKYWGPTWFTSSLYLCLLAITTANDTDWVKAMMATKTPSNI